MRFLLLAIAFAAFTPTASGQSTFAKGVLLTDESVTATSSRVAVRLTGPLSNAQDERKLRKLLSQPNHFSWNGSTPLHQIAKDLSGSVSFEIDVRALNDIGLLPNATYGVGDASSQKRSSKQAEVAKAAKEKWWASSSSSPRTGAATQSVGSKLFFVLDQLDLTINYQSGQWFITTKEAAEMALQVRLYDVTPLTGTDDTTVGQRPRPGGGFGMAEPQPRSESGLLHGVQMHIVPETWEMLGGPSSASIITAGDRRWLVVTTMPTVHWQIESFLNQVNGVK